jgi:hypothetical protein
VKIPWYAQLLLCGWIISRKNWANHPFITHERTYRYGRRGGINFVFERIQNIERGNTYVTSILFCAMGKCSHHSEFFLSVWGGPKSYCIITDKICLKLVNITIKIEDTK